MAVSTSLTIQDRMTNTLMRQISTIDRMINRMERLDKVSEQIDPGEGFDNAQQAVEELMNRLRRLEEQQNQVARGAHNIKGAWSGVNNIITKVLTALAAKKTFDFTVGAALDLDKLEREFQARLDSVDIGTAMYQKLQDQAKESAFAFDELAKNTLSFMSVTTKPQNLDRLNKLAERLAVFDKTGQGLEGAGFSLKEALSGDIVSLAERFNMSKAQIRAFGIDELGKKGDIEGFITQFEKLLDAQNMGEEAYEKMLQAPKTQMEMFLSNLKMGFAQASTEATKALAPLITRLNEWFASDSAEQFFASFASGLSTAVDFAMQLFDGVSDIANFISTNWPMIEPIVWGLATAIGGVVLALGIYKTVTAAIAIVQGIMGAAQMLATGATIAQTAAQWGLNSALLACPVTWIVLAIIALIAVIVGLIIWIKNLWEKNDQFAAGLLRAWNSILNFFDQVPIFFMKVGIGVVNAFFSMKTKALEIVDALVNGVIEGINWMIGVLNKIPGVSISAIETVDFASKAKLQEEAVRQAGDKVIAEMEANAAAKAAAREANVQQMLRERAEKRAADAAEQEAKKAANSAGKDYEQKLASFQGKDTNINEIGKVGEVGKINDEVDISEEDIKLLRDIAEQKFVQNFVTLTPQVTLTDIKISEKVDLDEVTAAIERKLEDEFVTAAEGVYS